MKRDEFNLFTGYGVTPSEGSCGRILQHIGEVIASGNVDIYNQFLALLAWQVQNVGKPSRIVVALYSEAQQTGKGFLLEKILLRLWDLHGIKITSQEHAFGRFNDALRGKSYLFIDEANFSGNRKLADQIKAEAAADIITIEAKGLAKMQFPAGLNIFMASNHRSVAHVELKDARYWTLEVSDCHAGDHAYFAELAHEVDNGGLKAFLHYLLNLNISSFIPQRDIARENELQIENKQNSLTGSPIAWLLECIDAGALVGGAQTTQVSPGQRIQGKDLLDAYRAWFKDNPDNKCQTSASPNIFWKIVTKLGFIEGRNKTERWRIVPDINSLKAAIDAEFTGRKYSEVTV